MLPRFEYIKAETVEEAIDQMKDKGSVLHAGGTDLLGCLRDGVFTTEKVISIYSIKELSGIRENDDKTVYIGPLTTISDVESNPLIRKRYPVIAKAASEVASPQLRNRGTIGGNLCQKPRCWYYRGEFPCLRKGGKKCYAAGREDQNHCIFGGNRCFIVHPSDMAPALSACDAKLKIKGPDRTISVSINDFFVLPEEEPTIETILAKDEMITGITLPPLKENSIGVFRKVRARRSWDFALASLAAVFEFEDNKINRANVYLGGAAPVPWRSEKTEKALEGKELTPETISSAAEAVVKDAQPLRHNGYKIKLFRGIVKEELLHIIQK